MLTATNWTRLARTATLTTSPVAPCILLLLFSVHSTAQILPR